MTEAENHGLHKPARFEIEPVWHGESAAEAECQVIKKQNWTRPKVSIKFTDEGDIPAAGRSTNSGSTLSAAMVISRKIRHQIGSPESAGSNGRKGRKRDAPAMLNMLPKFSAGGHEDILQVLAKVVLPSRTPCTRKQPGLFSRRTISADSLATSTARYPRNTTSAAWEGEASLMRRP